MITRAFLAAMAAAVVSPGIFAQEQREPLPGEGKPIAIWPGRAPGESTASRGKAQPRRLTDQPMILRVENITEPTMWAYLPKTAGIWPAVVVLPGGGFHSVVTNLEGAEPAEFLNDLGIAVFVLSYRTTADASVADPWRRPLQDAQRAVRFLRARSQIWSIDPGKIGILGFSAGAQVGALQISDYGDAYEQIDGIDEQRPRPDFAMLLYPWNVADSRTGALMREILISRNAPPTFIVHTHDDRSSSLGAVRIYTALKKASVPAELHIYQNGGHGFGVRDRGGSVIGTWPQRAADWLRIRGLAR